MSGISELFVDPVNLPHGGFGYVQLIFLICTYGYVLYRASKLIADGSEMLMLVLNPGLIGGLVLPVMGAVPDGAIVLFSGLGPDAQEQLKVGVGTLAGSTIMLLTIPWAASMVLGRVDLSEDGLSAVGYGRKPKLTKGWSWKGTGVQSAPDIPLSAKIMLATGITYLVIQGPSFAFQNDGSEATVATKEHDYALAGLILAVALFSAYSFYCVFSANSLDQQREKMNQIRKHAVAHKLVNLVTLMSLEMQVLEEELAKEGGSGSSGGAGSGGDGSGSNLLEGGAGHTGTSASHAVLRRLFDKFDTDGNGELDRGEVKAMLLSMGLKLGGEDLADLLALIGGADKRIQFNEFEDLIRKCVADKAAGASAGAADKAAADSHKAFSVQEHAGAGHAEGEGEEEEEDEEEDDEEEDEAAGMTPWQIKMKAFGLLALGVGLVTLFSDPMVDVLSELGSRLNISAFYISFVITPIVSNASELISSLIFAAKKTKKSINFTFSQLLGAATMNNSFCLAIFLGIVYAKQLAWEFSAEVMAILAVEAAILILVLTARNNTHALWRGYAALALYPASLLFVYLLENVAGWN